MDGRLAREFVEGTDALVCVVGGDGRVLLANPALQRLTGRSAEELLGRPFWDVWVVPEHRELARDAIERAMATGRAHPQEGDWLTGDGGRRLVSMHNHVLTDDDGRPYAVACVGLDVTDQRRWEAQLSERARTDRLTGIPNRGTFFEELGRRLAPDGSEVCGVLFCDLDGFKVVNDVHGHAVGDAVLVEVATRLRSLIGPDEVVARFGGDEFVVLCPGCDDEDLARLADRVEEQAAAPVPTAAGPLVVGVSVGGAVGHPGDSPDAVIARADRDMYGAKTRQRRRSER
ncbi:cyclic di-GMP phosphodiesterase Gmr [Geodermatophilus bullaregiensis]|uniref:GGDEF domain-containing protein n=1 Tax=Geodermatophilus bullaregiensis TaxID=1564160 RepID=UPI00195D5E58|nr:GGDEF domain-containing protein [Geodermatophilus bullaregiensis]MBM7806730.1 cyclic di-GMP phosphodiesterase Gmr [Geodermatophilus bullaregiensis]